MSDSRLEKFIYAICSMDVSDLPVPLSRIEKLWNCLITGETPDFEPLSRNEKYLMAMLDRYDISNLPAPMSRGEKLLYKIAVGETDLSDVPGYLSRYEELLKYLIENGGISGGDFEYVLYTLNQSLYTLYTTAEKPVKSAILKGQTLVNVVKQSDFSPRYCKATETNNGYIYTQTEFQMATRIEFDYSSTSSLIKNDTYYLVSFKFKNNKQRTVNIQTDGAGCVSYGNTFSENTHIHIKGKIKTASSGGTKFRIYVKCGEDIDYTDDTFEITELMLIEYQEDMENWDIPYFEGMQSVKMPVLQTVGKNMVNILDFTEQYSNGYYYDNPSTLLSKKVYIDYDGQITLSCKGYSKNVMNGRFRFVYTDGTTKDCAFLNSSDENNPVIIANKSEAGKKVDYITFTFSSIDSNPVVYFKELQVEGGTEPTSYEPYKSNILSTPSDLELRGIGDVRDELNLLTGELTQRINEVVLDGSESGWEDFDDKSFVLRGSYFSDSVKTLDTTKKIAISNKFNWGEAELPNTFRIYNWSGVLWTMFGKSSNNQTLEEFKAWLQANPLTVQYLLATESVKTVDLTVVDQDGNVTTLKTFDDTTHVLLQSEAGPNPTAELTVKTKIPTASSTNLLMDTVSTEQEQLNMTVNEQSNNVDATMIATTEIFEETL